MVTDHFCCFMSYVENELIKFIFYNHEYGSCVYICIIIIENLKLWYYSGFSKHNSTLRDT